MIRSHLQHKQQHQLRPAARLESPQAKGGCTQHFVGEVHRSGQENEWSLTLDVCF